MKVLTRKRGFASLESMKIKSKLKIMAGGFKVSIKKENKVSSPNFASSFKRTQAN